MHRLARVGGTVLGGVLGAVLAATPVATQWLHHPTADLPRNADGRLNLRAAPRTAQGNKYFEVNNAAPPGRPAPRSK